MNEEEKSRLKRYIENFHLTFNEIIAKNKNNEKISKILDLCEKYYMDSLFYFEKGDYFTSLTCISYAEGLLDCLRLLNIIEFEWKRDKIKKVLIAGTFDIIHPGHIWLIEKAKEYGRVIVIVATDKNVERFKGRKPIIPGDQRLKVIKSLKGVDEVFLGNESEDIVEKIKEIRPDIIILGPDQNFISPENLKNRLKDMGINVEVIKIQEEYKDSKFYKTSQIIHEIIRRSDEFKS